MSGRYDEAHGYPAPSVRVLVDVVEHQAGGADPALATRLAKLNLDDVVDSINGSQDGVASFVPRPL